MEGFNTFLGTGSEFANANDSAPKGKIHIRLQQRNRRQCITTIQGLDDDLDLKRMMRHMKKTFNTNGSIVDDAEAGQVIQLQGDQRDNVVDWLLRQEIITKSELDRIIRHGH